MCVVCQRQYDYILKLETIGTEKSNKKKTTQFLILLAAESSLLLRHLQLKRKDYGKLVFWHSIEELEGGNQILVNRYYGD